MPRICRPRFLQLTLPILVSLLGACGEEGGTGPGRYQISKVSGDAQAGFPGTRLIADLVVLVEREGSPSSNRTVTWSGTGLAATSTTTDAAGTSSNRWTLPVSAAGPVTVTARVGDGSPVTFTAVATPLGVGVFGFINGSDIILSSADGITMGNVTNNPALDFDFDWSPDGLSIIWASDRGGSQAIWQMNADGSGPTAFAGTAPGATPEFSIDGTKIAFLRGNDVYSMDANGSNITQLTTDPATDADPTWSPDTTQVVFESNRDGNYEIYVMNADGSGQTRLTNSAGEDADPHWSPDGSKIVFHSNRDGNQEIYTMDPDGGNQTNISNSPATSEGTPSWSPDGSKIIFVRGGAIFLMNANGSSPARIDNYPNGGQQPRLRP